MQVCYSHVNNDPDSKCASEPTSCTEIAGGTRGNVSFGLLTPRTTTCRRTPNIRRNAQTARAPSARKPDSSACRRHPGRERLPLIVLDASVLLEVLLETSNAARIGNLLSVPGETFHAPHLIDLEIAQVLRRYVLVGTITPTRGEEALADLLDFPLTRHSHLPLLDQIWEMRHGLTAYDAAYLALAEVLNARLITRDRAIAIFPSSVHVEMV
jgi:predicted nucleic acid-binding protein